MCKVVFLSVLWQRKKNISLFSFPKMWIMLYSSVMSPLPLIHLFSKLNTLNIFFEVWWSELCTVFKCGHTTDLYKGIMILAVLFLIFSLIIPVKNRQTWLRSCSNLVIQARPGPGPPSWEEGGQRENSLRVISWAGIIGGTQHIFAPVAPTPTPACYQTPKAE